MDLHEAPNRGSVFQGRVRIDHFLPSVALEQGIEFELAGLARQHWRMYKETVMRVWRALMGVYTDTGLA